ncbi:MAG: TolC family protein [Flavobacteriales bacterium]|nr:TolC family protein [Flavobacteriales bacterium]
MKKGVFLIVSLLAFGYVFGQDKKTWNLQECIEYALQHNPNLLNSQLTVEQASNNLQQDKLDRYPTLNSSASHNYNFGRTIDPFTNQFVNQSIQSNNFSLNSGVTLYNGYRLRNNINLSANSMERAELSKKAAENDLAMAVANVYLQIILAEKQLESLQETNKNTKTQMDQAKKLYEGGTANQSRYLTFKAQDARDQMNIQTAKSTIRMVYLQLIQLMQLPSNEAFQIDIPQFSNVPLAVPYSMNDLMAASSKALPNMQIAENQVKASELSEKIAEAALYPRLMLFGNVNTLYSESRLEKFNPTTNTVPIGYVQGTNEPVLSQFTSYQTKTSPFGNQLSDNFGQAIGLSLSIPIYNNNQAKTSVENAKISTEMAQNNLQVTQNQLNADIIQSYSDFENSVAAYQSALENKKAQQENYDFSKKTYEAGVATAAEMIIAQNNLSQAEIDLERAKMQLIFNHTLLEFYNSGEIKLVE